MPRIISIMESSSMTIEEVLQNQDVDPEKGLNQGDVPSRISQYGYNELAQEEEETLIQKFIEQLQEPMILLLLISAGISILLKQYEDAFSIIFAILIVSTVAFVQEYRSEKSLEALNTLVPPMATVLRDGETHRIEARELALGDVVILHIGDRVPADIRLFTTNSLLIDESSLTGENEPVTKHSNELESSSPLPSDVKNQAYMGTMVVNGNGRGIVVAIGESTEFGRVFSMVKDVEAKRTPLQKRMDHLGKQISIISIVVIVFIVFIGVLQHKSLLSMFSIGVSLAVAAIPEGLPIVVTVTLALSVLRMVDKKVIVKRLPAVEALGSTTVICSDKTGTLTKNEMTLTTIITSENQTYEVSGVGFNSNGEICRYSLPVDTKNPPKLVRDMLTIGYYCNNSSLQNDSVVGKPSEMSIVYGCQKLNLTDPRINSDRLLEIPFSSDSKYMAVLYQNGNTKTYYYKGAPEVILSKCANYARDESISPLTENKKLEINQSIHHLQNEGLRVIAFAKGDDETNLVYYGIVGILDPPREGVVESIESFYSCGIRLCIITGDAERTAISIGKKLHLDRYQQLCTLSGADVEYMSLDDLKKIIKKINIFYRMTPRHKMKIIEAYQAVGEVIAMTGDGVNDSPALKLADIGVSMGLSGTDISKEAADIILVDDNFSTILNAIEEGRMTFINIRNFVRFQLSTSIGALLLIMICTIFDLPNPMNASQILWINILMDGPPAQSLGVEPVDKDVLNSPPRDPKEKILSSSLVKLVALGAVYIVILTIYVFYVMLEDGHISRKDVTMTFTTFVFCDLFLALSCRSPSKSIFTIGLFSNKPFLWACGFSIFGQLMVIYFPPFQRIFQTESLSLYELSMVIFIPSLIFWCEEIRKYLFNRNTTNRKISFELLPEEPNDFERNKIKENNKSLEPEEESLLKQ